MIELKPDNGWIAEDVAGKRYPWFTAGALEYLNQIDYTNKQIYEFGCGYSTLWFRSRGAVVHGVDSTREWADFAGVQYLPEKEQYLNPKSLLYWLGRPTQYDIAVVDGEWRDECASLCIQTIKPGGLVIIDNWMQPSVPPNEWFRTLDLMAANGLPHIVYRQPNHPDWSTLIIQC